MIEVPKIPRPDEDATKGRIENIEEAHIGALAENEFRKMLEGLDLTEEERKICEIIADKRGKWAIQKYREFLEKHPLERLKHKLEEIAEQMRQEGLHQDAEIVEKVFPRIQALIETVKTKKEDLEERHNRRFTVKEMQQLPFHRTTLYVPIIWEVGNRGGWVYKPGVGSISWFKPEDADKFQIDEGWKKLLEQTQGELINYSFSKRGMEIFLQAFGIVEKGQGFMDIKVSNPSDYHVIFEAGKDELPGVKIDILFNAQRSYDKLREIRIGLILEPEFLEAALRSFNA